MQGLEKEDLQNIFRSLEEENVVRGQPNVERTQGSNNLIFSIRETFYNIDTKHLDYEKFFNIDYLL